MRVRKIRILIIILVVIGAIGLIGIFVAKKQAASKKPTIVRVEEVQPGELIEFVSAPARHGRLA